MNKKKFLLRILFYSLGAFFCANGVVLTINANLGVSAASSLPYVLSLVTNIDVGICFMAFFVLLISAQIIILRKDFKWVNLTQIIFATMFGYFVIIAEFIIGDFTLASYPGRLLILLAGNFMIALGVTMYVDVKLVPMPVEGLANALMQKIKKPFYLMKITVDSGTALCALIISLLAFGRILGLREGTLISSVMIGWMIKMIQKVLHPIMEKLCFDNKENV